MSKMSEEIGAIYKDNEIFGEIRDEEDYYIILTNDNTYDNFETLEELNDYCKEKNWEVKTFDRGRRIGTICVGFSIFPIELYEDETVKIRRFGMKFENIIMLHLFIEMQKFTSLYIDPEVRKEFDIYFENNEKE